MAVSFHQVLDRLRAIETSSPLLRVCFRVVLAAFATQLAAFLFAEATVFGDWLLGFVPDGHGKHDHAIFGSGITCNEVIAIVEDVIRVAMFVSYFLFELLVYLIGLGRKLAGKA